LIANQTNSRLLLLFIVLALSFTVRGLTMRFIRDHLGDPAWFQSGSYALFDRQAQSILDGKASVFWIDDAAHTEAAVYPPGYPLWLALIYKLTGERTAENVQIVQWVLDALSVLLVVGVAATAFDFRVGWITGVLAALAPVLALSGVTPLADAPTSWLIIAGVWALLLAWKTENLAWALGAGLFVGASCWLRANALLLALSWSVVLFLLVRGEWQKRLRFSLALALGAALLIVPLLVRNAIAFRAFVPTGLGLGTNLWEGIGETDRAAEFGAVVDDQKVVEQERKELGLPDDAPLTLYSPNGVERDRARVRKALKVIAAHPLWYSGVMLKRMWGMLKFAGEPIPYHGSMGINITTRKTLPASWQGHPLAAPVTLLGMIQSVFRYLALPLILGGLWLAFRLRRSETWLLLSTVLYYLVLGSALHMEIRYGLAMQSLLLIFAAVCITRMIDSIRRRSASEVWR
jgi:4-amino-4-deoxy-L-arabinose transferase-like glycosyltransferase